MFDVIVVVDWSAAARPATGADSIWFCLHDVSTGVTIPPVNPSTRDAAVTQLADLLHARAGQRILVGFDFSLGFPRGFARAAGLVGDVAWSAMWAHLSASVHDGTDNSNNRFAVASALNASISDGVGPFWGTGSIREVTPWLLRTKAPGFPHVVSVGTAVPNTGLDVLAEFRLTERNIASRGRRPLSTWQLAGAGSVGGQTLTGIPAANRLRHDPRLADRVMVWPFETGLCADPTIDRADAIVFAEAWPSSIEVDRARHPVKDAAQVISLAEHLGARVHSGAIALDFAPQLSHADRSIVVAEEGWILGAPATRADAARLNDQHLGGEAGARQA